MNNSILTCSVPFLAKMKTIHGIERIIAPSFWSLWIREVHPHGLSHYSKVVRVEFWFHGNSYLQSLPTVHQLEVILTHISVDQAHDARASYAMG